MTDFAYEPFVILERGGTPATEARPVGRRTSFRGRKPALMIVDREGTGLDVPLAAQGFEVYRTTARDSALELLRAHPSILMALVRTDLSTANAVDLVRDLRRVRPGLWIGIWADPADRERSAEAFGAGATDLIPSTADPRETAERLARSLSWAIRLQEEAERRENRRRRGPSAAVRRVVGGAAALALGAVLALATRAWHDRREAWSDRLDRYLGSLESMRPSAVDRQFDRWSRTEQLRLLREHDFALRGYYLEQLELQRARDLLAPAPAFTSEGSRGLPDTGGFPRLETRPVR